MPDPLLSASAQPVHDALVEAGVNPNLAYTAAERVLDVAGHNVMTAMYARFDALAAQLAAVRWMIGAILALLAVIVSILAVQVFSQPSAAPQPPTPTASEAPPPQAPPVPQGQH